MTDTPGFPLFRLAIRYEPDVVTARQKTRGLAEMLGFDGQDQARLATAVSELARNVFQYAGSGQIEFFFSQGAPQLFSVRVSDAGPGIAELDAILAGTYRSSSGMGVGLSGTKKLMDSFRIETAPGRGTVITIGKTLDRRARFIGKEELGQISLRLLTKQADNPFEEMQNQNRELVAALEEVRSAKAELAELNRELAETNRGVVALYAELDEKAASLQRANEVKTGFLSNMTHEFRTPLSSIISLTRLLLSRTDGDLTSEQEKQVNYIRQSSEGLLELVNDLLDLAKVEAGKVAINSSDFNAEEILSGVRGMFRPLLAAQPTVELRVAASEPFALRTDQAKLSQILRNLVSNAIKFTEQGSVTVTAALEPGDIVHFAVTDTGMGIEPRHLEAIFADFSQVDSRLQRKQKGTGLGLPLSRKLARLLGGDLTVESEVGRGSTFHVRLPRIYEGLDEAVLITHAADAGPPVTEASEKFRVLVIDDDEPSRYVLKSLVGRQIDANFKEAADGESGLEAIRQWNPDVVFLDLSMPMLDGFGVLRAVHADPHLGHLPLIVNTAKKLSAEERAFLEREATAVLSKERTDNLRAVAELRDALQRAGFDYRERTLSP